LNPSLSHTTSKRSINTRPVKTTCAVSSLQQFLREYVTRPSGINRRRLSAIAGWPASLRRNRHLVVERGRFAVADSSGGGGVNRLSDASIARPERKATPPEFLALDEALGELDLFDARVADSRDLKLCRERGRQDATSAHPAVFMNATGWVAGLLIPLARQLVGGQQTNQ
jgi:hypothetical protein